MMQFKKGQMSFEITDLAYQLGQEIESKSLVYCQKTVVVKNYYVGSFAAMIDFPLEKLNKGCIVDGDKTVITNIIAINSEYQDPNHVYFFYTIPTVKECL